LVEPSLCPRLPEWRPEPSAAEADITPVAIPPPEGGASVAEELFCPTNGSPARGLWDRGQGAGDQVLLC
jgi:hypothetical protein